jgi:thiol-disulfide isomerase/thioredoxin
MGMARPRVFYLGWAAVVLLFCLAWLLFQQGMSGVHSFDEPAALGKAAVDKPLPNGSLTLTNGTATTLHAYVGHPLWINFFETWCPPCKAEVPDIERRFEADKSKGLVVLGVDIEETPKAAQTFSRLYKTTYPMAIDDGRTADEFDVQTIPVSVFVDARGEIRLIRVGQLDPTAMDAALAKIM